ncbi:F-box/kelch-repeat protein At3g23880-like [Impatiens glandulifera]|uniref:F-box/kelch-repeat protein At3g23880-like n=1 Tax=Impatiens glandulifera TaxID=253017 RepID=UPI001FB0DF53|nr:F-box/kelch-repeat protein At3g23880-like [Impatiens glandulifera]XP_047323945.1 F-box/kelch-repeat protein At3g23880-like [Impatiens glandulifera]
MENPSDDSTDGGESKRKRGKTIQQYPTSTDDDCYSVHFAASMPEIVAEILIRLPVKTLLQFRCVCRSWRTLISDPIFVKMHLRASTEYEYSANHRLIMSSALPRFDVKSCSLSSVLHEESPTTYTLDYPLKHPDRSVRIVGSVNGLVCIAIDEAVVFLWNPSTRKSKRLPHCGVTKRQLRYGFGYDEGIADDYKVVVVVGKEGSYDEITEVKMYGLKSDSWRKIGDFPKAIPLQNASVMFVSGSLHWASASEKLGKSIVSLNLSKETYSEISLPCYGQGVSVSMVGVLSGCLSLLCNIGVIKADLWMMKEYGKVDSWSKLFSIPYLHDPEYFQYSTLVFFKEK